MSDQPDPREEKPMYADNKGNLYRSKHEIPASELMGAFYQDLLGISQGFADELTIAKERIDQLESRIHAAIEQAKARHDLALAALLMSLLEGE